MRERGDIDWTKARAPGARYEHCVYTIHENYWKPPSHATRAKISRPAARSRIWPSAAGARLTATSPPNLTI
jgi:hypothetical protein